MLVRIVDREKEREGFTLYECDSIYITALNNTIEKSEDDKSHFKSIVLRNKVRTITLVKDPNVTSLTVMNNDGKHIETIYG